MALSSEQASARFGSGALCATPESWATTTSVKVTEKALGLSIQTSVTTRGLGKAPLTNNRRLLYATPRLAAGIRTYAYEVICNGSDAVSLRSGTCAAGRSDSVKSPGVVSQSGENAVQLR